jgi:hypothetical protein
MNCFVGTFMVLVAQCYSVSESFQRNDLTKEWKAGIP